MDDLQKKVVKATELYPEVLMQHSALKRVMADIFENERIKGRAFCLAFGLGIVDACTCNHDSIKDIFDSLKDDYSVSDEVARWVIFTWCEVYNLNDYEKFLEPASAIDMIDSIFGDAVDKISDYVIQQQEAIEQEKRRKEEEQRLKALQVKKVLEKYNKYRDGLETSDAIDLFVTLFTYLQKKRIILDSVVVEKGSNQRITVSASSSKMTLQGKIGDFNVSIGVNDRGVKLQKTDNYEEKKAICLFLEDLSSAREVLEGLKLIVNFVVQNNFEKCTVTEKGLAIKGIKVNMTKKKFYYGSQLLS